MTKFLKKVPIFSPLKDTDIDKLLKISKEKSFYMDEVILHKDEAGDALFVILSGKVKVSLFSKDGREVILSILEEGEFFGEMALLDRKPRSATVVAIEDTSILILERKDFITQVSRSPDIAIRMLEEFTTRLRRADDKIGSLVLLDVYARVTQYLVGLARDRGIETEDGVVVKNKPAHHEIASEIGTTRETVSRILNDLRRGGYLIVSGKDFIFPNTFPPLE